MQLKFHYRKFQLLCVSAWPNALLIRDFRYRRGLSTAPGRKGKSSELAPCARGIILFLSIMKKLKKEADTAAKREYLNQVHDSIRLGELIYVLMQGEDEWARRYRIWLTRRMKRLEREAAEEQRAAEQRLAEQRPEVNQLPAQQEATALSATRALRNREKLTQEYVAMLKKKGVIAVDKLDELICQKGGSHER